MASSAATSPGDAPVPVNSRIAAGPLLAGARQAVADMTSRASATTRRIARRMALCSLMALHCSSLCSRLSITMPETRVAFDDADAYDRYMGRWSRAIGEKFLAWLDLPAHRSWLDV